HPLSTIGTQTLENYISSLRSWHDLHATPWPWEKDKPVVLTEWLRGISNIMGQTTKKTPVSNEMMVSLERNLDLPDPLDACVWAAAVTGLYRLCRLGELLPKSKPSFSPKTHMTRDKIFPEFDIEGLPYLRLRLPKDKVSKGKLVSISIPQARIGNTISLEAILNHLCINCTLNDSDPLFAYRSQKEHTILPLTKRAFLDRCKNIWSRDAEVSGGIDNVSGHSFRIGGARRLWALRVGV
ncbi:hypothetical protein BT69DRAFT_1234688, partial [Atractiella rhizophila]